MRRWKQRLHFRRNCNGRIFRAGRYRVKMMRKNVMKDYLGMNPEAAKVFEFNPKPKFDEIFVAPQNKTEMDRTIKHEVIEADLMKNNNMSYWEAHKRALREENHPIRQLERKYG